MKRTRGRKTPSLQGDYIRVELVSRSELSVSSQQYCTNMLLPAFCPAKLWKALQPDAGRSLRLYFDSLRDRFLKPLPPKLNLYSPFPVHATSISAGDSPTVILATRRSRHTSESASLSAAARSTSEEATKSGRAGKRYDPEGSLSRTHLSKMPSSPRRVVEEGSHSIAET
jgi:hypothetical protein